MTISEIESLRNFNAIKFEKEFVTSTLEVKPRGFLMVHFPRAVKWIRDTKAFAWLQETTFVGRIFPKVDANPLLAVLQVERKITVILADSEKANDAEVQAIIQTSIVVATNLLGHYASTTSPASKANGWMDIANNLQRFVPAAPQNPVAPETLETKKPEEEKTNLPEKKEEPTLPATPNPAPTDKAIEPEVIKTPEKKTGDEIVARSPVTPAEAVTTTVATPDAPVKKTEEKKQPRRRREATPVTTPTKNKVTNNNNPPATPRKPARKK